MRFLGVLYCCCFELCFVICVCVFVICIYIFCVLFVYLSLLFCSYFVVLCIFIFVCTSVGLLPPGESPIAVSSSSNSSNLTSLLCFPSEGRWSSVIGMVTTMLTGRSGVWGRSLAGVAGLDPAGYMNVCVVYCKLRHKEKCRTITTKNRERMKYKQSTR